MKYHYQYVSSTKVRIELIPEDQKDKDLIEQLSQNQDQDQPQLQALFTSGIQAYMPGATLTKVNYMNFPKVALCNFNKALKAKNEAVA